MAGLVQLLDLYATFFGNPLLVCHFSFRSPLFSHPSQKGNDVLAVTWIAEPPHGGIALRSVVASEAGGGSIAMIDEGSFEVLLQGGAEDAAKGGRGAGVKIDSRTMTLAGPVVSRQLEANNSRPRLAERSKGVELVAMLTHPSLQGCEVKWTAELRDGSNYV